MKKLSFLALAVVGLLFGACSDSDVTDQGGQSEKDGKGYLAVQIQLPSVPASSTRAENDNYDDGLPAEYAVNNAALLLFHGATEAGATFYQAIALTLPLEVIDVDNDNLTSSYLAVSEVDDTYTTDLWALALVNYTGVFNLGTKTFMGNNGALGTDFALAEGTTTIADLQAAVFANSFNGSGFFMTNAVLSSAPGGSVSTAPTAGDLSVLAKLADDCIKDTEKEAKQNPAGTVFVERAVAKATLSVTPTTIGTMTITDVQWSLSGTETSSYLVRNMFNNGGTPVTDYMGYSSAAFASPYYRFGGSVKIGQTAIQPTVDLYRTYWCVDPQYSVTATLNTTTSFGATGVNNPQYCYENTFNVDKQSYDNTTRAIIKVTTNGGDFYTINGADTKSSEGEALSALMAVYMTDVNVQKAFSDNYIGGGTYTVDLSSFDLSSALTVNGTTAVVTLDGSAITPASSLSSSDFNLVTLAADLAAASPTAAATANAYVDVLKYTDGVMYYEARIQHFAQTSYEKASGAKTAAAALAAGDLAPWNFWETTKPAVGNTSKAYPTTDGKDPEQNYLGRYGMVRNNWYDIQVTAFEHFGEPVEPSFPINPTPDDNVNSKYIAVKINVLSWAKRTQGWSF
jgi:hypothetical protein